MAGYTRQSSADIIPTAVVRSAPVNAEFNAIRDAFAFSSGHKHDGSSSEGAYIPLIADTDGNNKVTVNTGQNRVEFYSEVSSSPVAQVYLQDGVILPAVDNDIDLGSSSVEFKNLYLDGIARVDTLNVDENATVSGSFSVTGSSTLPSVNIDGGTIDGTTIGNSSASAITGTVITANTQFSGDLVGNVTGNVTGDVTGDVTGNVEGNLTGNVAAATGSSTFNNVTVNGTLDVTGTTIANVTDPVNAQDAATKNYVDTQDALKLNLTGGTMSGAIAMGTNKITGLDTPASTADAATKGYVDTSISNLIDSSPAALDTLNELAAALGDDPNFATTVTNEIATKLSLSGGTMTGDITLGANKATSTSTPTTDDTLTRKGYVDSQDALKLNLTGGTMSGAIAMDTNKITGMGDPTASQDAATKDYVDSADATKLNLSGGTMTGNIVMGSNKVTSDATPTSDSDLTRKAYVDSILGSATAAADSAAAAATSETNAATSETNAANSASAAATSETNAANSASAAATSETNAATSETNAASSASAAAASEANVAASASAASASATDAAASASAAASSETNAAASASAAATSETNAATSETNAANSASAAATSEANAAASYDAFDDRYLGSKAFDPATDNDGNALLTGAIYWNTVDDQLKIWDGSNWQNAAFNTAGAVILNNWTITESGGSLYFAAGGTNYMKLDASGNLQITGSIDTVATIS